MTDSNQFPTDPFLAKTIALLLACLLVCGCNSDVQTQHPKDNATPDPAVAKDTNEPSRDVEPDVVKLPPEQPEQAAPTDWQGLHRKALIALESENSDLAYALGREAERAAPDEPQVAFMMARILAGRNRFPEAIARLDQLSDSTPSLQLPILGQTAEWMTRFGQWEKAEKRYRKILQAVPDANIVHRNLAWLLIRQGRRSEAANHLNHLCATGDVTNDELRCLLVMTHAFTEDIEKETFEPIGPLGIARYEIGQGQLQAALEHLEQITSVDTKRPGLRCRVLAAMGKFETASKLLESTSWTGGLSADAWFVKGILSARDDDHADAIRCFAETVLQNQTDHEAYTMLSNSLNKHSSDSEKADEASRRATMILRTQTIGATMATDADGSTGIAELIGLLDQLQRKPESLSWQAIKLDYDHREKKVTDDAYQQRAAAIEAERKLLSTSEDDGARRRFRLCGVDLKKLQTPTVSSTDD